MSITENLVLNFLVIFEIDLPIYFKYPVIGFWILAGCPSFGSQHLATIRLPLLLPATAIACHCYCLPLLWPATATRLPLLLPTTAIRLSLLLACHCFSPATASRLPLLLACHCCSPATTTRLPLLLACHYYSPATATRLPLLLACHCYSPATATRWIFSRCKGQVPVQSPS